MEERNTLLIVDDFEFNRLMLSDTFSDRRVVEAENGKRAIEEFEKNKDKLCAVLLDIMMPVMDGFGVLEYLVDNKYIDDIPVFIISADTSDKSLSRAYDLGAVALFICYKFTKERVVATAEQTANVKTTDLFHELRHNRPLVILGMFFMLAFTFMFFMNTVNGFFNQFVVGHSEWMGAVGLVASIPGIAFPVFWPKLKKIFGKKGFFHLFLAMFIVGELLTYVWSREGMHDALWLAYIATFIKQWGLTSATGFMWALVPEVIAYGELKSGKRNAAIINAIMGLFFKIGFTIGGAIPLWLLAVYGFNESGAVQSASAIDGIIMTAVWIPIALAAISMVIMQVYPISDKHVTDINRQLDEIRV